MYTGAVADAHTERYAKEFDHKYPWFDALWSDMTVTMDQKALKEWKARMPGGKPLPWSEIYQRYDTGKYSKGVVDRLTLNNYRILFGSVEGLELMANEVDGRLDLLFNGSTVYFFRWASGKVLKEIEAGDMGTYSLFRFGAMAGDFSTNHYLMSEAGELLVWREKAEAALARENSPYQGNPKAFTADFGFPVTSMELALVTSLDGTFIGYKSIMNIDWTQRVKTQKSGYVGFYHTK